MAPEHASWFIDFFRLHRLDGLSVAVRHYLALNGWEPTPENRERAVAELVEPYLAAL